MNRARLTLSYACYWFAFLTDAIADRHFRKNRGNLASRLATLGSRERFPHFVNRKDCSHERADRVGIDELSDVVGLIAIRLNDEKRSFRALVRGSFASSSDSNGAAAPLKDFPRAVKRFLPRHRREAY